MRFYNANFELFCLLFVFKFAFEIKKLNMKNILKFGNLYFNLHGGFFRFLPA